MIVTEQKKFEQILKYLDHAEKVFVVGCGTCCTTCQTGGEEQVRVMVKRLEGSGKKVVGWTVVETPCDERVCQRDLKPKQKEIAVVDDILVMSCGVGVQVVGDITDKYIHPALDSLFLGKMRSLGRFNEFCLLCGDCVLEDTGGICPVSRCSKRLLNGPCGGSREGKCEVAPEYDCGWNLIYERLKKRGKLKQLTKFRQPKDYSKVIRPRKVETR